MALNILKPLWCLVSQLHKFLAESIVYRDKIWVSWVQSQLWTAPPFCNFAVSFFCNCHVQCCSVPAQAHPPPCGWCFWDKYRVPHRLAGARSPLCAAAQGHSSRAVFLLHTPLLFLLSRRPRAFQNFFSELIYHYPKQNYVVTVCCLRRKKPSF